MKTVLFFKTSEPIASAVEWLSQNSGLSRLQLRELFDLGAIYFDKKRLVQDRSLDAGVTLRVHTRPKRFSSEAICWKDRILAETPDFIAVDKPAGIPCHPTLDNQLENQLFCYEHLLQAKLFPVQRLDIQTSGVCLIGKTAEFQHAFHRLLKSERTAKLYVAICSASPPLGKHVHYLEKRPRPPHKVHLQKVDGTKECRLEILSSESLANRHARVTLRLFTGRTHQIRAQLSFLGCPLVGDGVYGDLKLNCSYQLHSTQLEFQYKEKNFKLTSACPW